MHYSTLLVSIIGLAPIVYGQYYYQRRGLDDHDELLLRELEDSYLQAREEFLYGKHLLEAITDNQECPFSPPS
jgi:hypothetical protein